MSTNDETQSALAIRRFARVFTGATPRRDNPRYWEGGAIPWLNSGAVNQRRITKPSEFITVAGYESSSTRMIPAGSVVMALAGQGRTKGMVATVESPMAGNQSLAAIRPDSRIVDYRYLAYALESRYRDIRSEASDELRNGLNLEHVRSFKVVLRPLEEQCLIVRYLDHAELRITKAIAGKNEVLAKLQEAKTSVISELVLGDQADRIDTGVPGLGSVPSHWRRRRAKYIWRAVDVRSTTGTEERLTVSSARGIVPRSSTTVTMFEAASYIGHKLVEPGNLVINSLWSWATGLGVSKHHGIVSPVYGVYTLIDYQCDLAYLDHLLRSNACQWQFQVRSKGIWKSRLSLTDEAFLDMMLVLPPLEEQRKIARRIGERTSAIDAAMDAVNAEIALLREYRTRLITDVVTGKIDVREQAAKLPDINPVELAAVLAGGVAGAGEEEVVDGDD